MSRLPDLPLRMFCTIVLALFCGSASAASSVLVVRCEAADGSVRFQQQACTAGQHEVRLQLTGDPAFVTPPPTDKAKRSGQAHAKKTAGRIRRVRAAPLPNCPPTRESPGVLGRHLGKAAWLRFVDLPSQTYLKNTGRWPKRCLPLDRPASE